VTEGNAATIPDSNSSGDGGGGGAVSAIDAVDTVVGTTSDGDADVVSTYY